MPELPTLPPIATAPLSVVLTARAGAAIEESLAQWTSYLNTLGRDFELILAEGASRDSLAEQVADLAERFPQVSALCPISPRGEGAVLAAGLAMAKYPLVFYCPCEPAYRPEDLGKLLTEIDKVHIVSGCRAGRRAPLAVRLARLLYSLFCTVVFSHRPAPSPGWLGWKRLCGRWLARAGFGLHSRDVACPYRLLRREILVRIPLQSRGSFVHVELLAKANFLGHLIAEELPLGDGEQPVATDDSRPERLRDVIADAWHVFSHPGFGPAKLPEPSPVPAEVSEPPQPLDPPPLPSP
jgi:glycosyltransferase involved in cell wall biosynthesis